MGGHLAFGAPWILGFLIALPVLWWLLRLTPPTPKKIPFPALALLRDLITSEQTPSRTPWWLLLLRIFIAGLVVFALADPLIDPQPTTAGMGAVLIAIDNDWASARAWDDRQQALHHFIHEAERENREVILLPTAPPASGDGLQILGPMAAKAAYSVADRIAPMPWPSNWNEARDLLGKIDPAAVAYSLWFNSGLGGGMAENFFKTLSAYGTVTSPRVFSDPLVPVYLLAPPKTDTTDNSFAITRAVVDNDAEVSLVARGTAGQILARAHAKFAPGIPHGAAALDVPLDAHNEMERVEIEGVRTAAATVLLDEDWQRRPVGLIGDKAEESEHSLLSDVFYIDRALKPFADIHVGLLDKLLAQNMAVLVLTDEIQLGDDELGRLSDWVEKGGVFVRFAGDRLASVQNPKESELLPVALRTGDRAMGGSMSWSTPQKLNNFAAPSPFQGLSIPPDVTISRQILAEPGADLAQKTWAALNDGTPLVTAKPMGRGISILFHVPARSGWSNLPLSGLFVEMLRRIVDLSHTGNIGTVNYQSLAPLQMLDAFGDEQAPGSAAKPLDADTAAHIEAGPKHPPGYYGSEGIHRALNLGAALSPPEPLKNISAETYQLKGSETDLQSALLAAAFILLLTDFWLGLRLRGLLVWSGVARRKAGKVALCLTFLALGPQAAHATGDDKAATELTSKTYLAYVETGSLETDHVSAAGLEGLARVLQRRTSLDDIGVTGVNLETDELVFFPLLYWPLNLANPPLSAQAAQRVNDYLRHGGMILFDSGSSDQPFTMVAMKSRLGGVEIPPLVRIPDKHVLRRSFYLLDQFPGRNAGGDLWLEPEELATFDGVASVIAGNGAWAGAWAVGENGRPLYPCTPGGEEQREYAYRFGVNIVMYALTGNYKSDQLHARALLEKLNR